MRTGESPAKFFKWLFYSNITWKDMIENPDGQLVILQIAVIDWGPREWVSS